jgi:hypothetical protein
MDCREASVFRFGAGDIERAGLHADNPYLKLNHKAGSMGAGRLAADLDFYDRIIDSLRGTRRWYLVGPDGTRQGLVDYLEKYKSRDGHIADLCRHLGGVSTMDRPTDAGLLAVRRGEDRAG